MTSIILRNNEKDRLKGGLFGLSRCYQHHLNRGNKSETTYYQRITCRRGQRNQIRVQYSVIERVSQVCASIPAGFLYPHLCTCYQWLLPLAFSRIQTDWKHVDCCRLGVGVGQNGETSHTAQRAIAHHSHLLARNHRAFALRA